MSCSSPTHDSRCVAAYAKTAQPDAALRLLKRMRTAGVSPDTVTYNSVIDAHARAGELHQASAIVRRMERGEAGDEAQPDVVSYTCLISSLARRGRLSEAAGWLEHVRSNTSVEVDATLYNIMVAGYASKAMWTKVGQLFDEMGQDDIRPDQWTYGPLLEASRKNGQRKRARALARRMLRERLPSEPLSPFCIGSIKRCLGMTQLKLLVSECGVPWDDVEVALAKSEEKAAGAADGRGGGRRRGRGAQNGRGNAERAGARDRAKPQSK